VTDLPWRSEHAVDAALVARLVDAQFPRLAPARAVHLADGWDFSAWCVNDAWVLRLPKRAEVAPVLAIEEAMLPLLARVLPVPIPVPELFGNPSTEFPHRFLGYRRLDGRPAAPSPRRPDPAHATTLAALLSRLHAFVDPAAPSAPVSIPVCGPRPALARARAWWPTMRGRLPAGLAARVEALLREDDPPPPGFLRLCHSDLRPDHVLLSEDGRRMTGILDWSDLCFDDPAMDFAGLVLWGGRPFLERALSSYEGRVDDGLRARACRRAALSALSLLGQAVRTDSPADVAWACGQLERSV
jgi:aminoglycoside phosphotransferase (APT) family kinase protein